MMSLATVLESFAPATLPAETEALRARARAVIDAQAAHLPPQSRVRSWTAWDEGLSRALSAAGLIGLTLPKAYGGAGLGPFHRFAVVEELLAAGAPVAAHWIGDRQSAPLIHRFGTEDQRRYWLPKIIASEVFFCIGMSEPGAGSDLAAVRTKAVRDGNGWRLSGAKLWSTWGHKADMMIALVRTDGTPEDRQKGLSQFLVDLKAPGVDVRPITNLAGDSEFSETRFDDVFLPPEALVGAQGEGWSQVTAELAFERSGPERIYSSIVLLDLWTRHLARDPAPAAAARLGRHLAHMAALREMSIALTARLAEGQSPVVAAALLKDLGTAFEQAVPADIADLITPDADPDLIATLAWALQLAPAFSIRGGTREILRGMIARGLGLR
jgi:alkylation response protein AidB-like acyl-CoA dehydrogenase